ncbi:MAG: c-type cytochrome [Acidimicrobiia bacterium]
MRRLMILSVLAASLVGCVGRPPAGATGEEIYLQLCSNCHGDRLQGALGPALGSGSNAARQPDEFLTMTISDGRGRMPSFDSSLSRDQVDRLVSYLRAVQGQ